MAASESAVGVATCVIRLPTTSTVVPKTTELTVVVPVPLGASISPPSVLVVEIVLPFKVTLSTFSTSILLFTSTRIALFGVSVPNA